MPERKIHYRDEQGGPNKCGMHGDWVYLPQHVTCMRCRRIANLDHGKRRSSVRMHRNTKRPSVWDRIAED